METLWDLLACGADGAEAIGAPGQPALDFAGLRRTLAGAGTALGRCGIQRSDAVALVFDNGPLAATTFLAAAGAAVAAPLNPAYREDEFAFYLEDLQAKALLVVSGSTSPAVAVARRMGVPIIEAVPSGLPGEFTLEGETAVGGGAASAAAKPDDAALVLHTSGTTARPKIVPLSHGNLAASARHIGQALQLTEADRCLNIMPLFHIHGLIAAVTSSLAAGGSVVCTPGFDAFRFGDWLAEVEPSWFTAVPTMHQAILARLGRRADVVPKGKLRFIRSSSASLPPQVMTAVEALFEAPVIESYGMTEATHQMASNPLPPRARKPGSVGIAAGPEVAIMDDDGRLVPQGEIGEVVIRGPNVTAGYARNPDANLKAFTEGWFRTGDQGRLDEEGYLFLTGRLKELINRGGEKVSPLEIDTVLMDHPAVAQVATFGLPHAGLGEEVAAAIVLREGATLDERELRDFAAARLAPFKVPRKIVFLAEIPKGPTGKMQRIGLAKQLGLAS